MSNSATESSRSRIQQLLDDNSFVEIGSRITARSTDFNMEAQKADGDGVVTGYGTINGILVFVYSQDPAVLGGSIGEMHAEKIVRMYDMEVRMGAPVIGILDCSGLRLQEATDALEGFGKIYRAESRASGVVPQITAVFGTCGGGLAIAASMSDFVFMEKDAKLFVNSPNALAGSDETKLDTASAGYQASKAGLVQGVGTADEIFGEIRDLVSLLPSNNEEGVSSETTTDDANRLTASMNQYDGDSLRAITDLADNGRVIELGKDFGPMVVTALVRLNGCTVGIVANRSARPDENGEVEKMDKVLCPKGAEKAAKFIRFCDAFEIPVLTMVDVEGFAKKPQCEPLLARAVGKLTAAYAAADVPMVTLITGSAYGSAAVSMGSRALGADLVFAWPDAKIGAMDAKTAVEIMYADEIDKADRKADFIREKTAEYEKLTGTAEAAAKRGYVDEIIEVAETRKRVIAAFEMLFMKSGDRPERKHGTI